MTWQPISTAPKDGTPIIVAGPSEKGWCYGVAFWNPNGNSWVGDCLEVTGIWETGSAWFEPDEVTHWQPLPAPPED